MSIPVYNCIIDDSVNDITGIYAISFVDLPANEVDFVALNKNTPVLLNKDSKKQILTGVVLKPDQLIYRFSEQSGEYYIKFSAEQIERIAQKMMKTTIALYNTTHQHEIPLDGNYLTELWIVENPDIDKSKALGFKDLPKGTLMCSYKIEDKNYWDTQVMSGNVKGFSLEGFFNQELNLSKINNHSNKKNEGMKKKKFNFSSVERKALKALSLAGILSKDSLSEIEAIEKEDKTESGEPYVVFVLKDGKEVFVDEDGFATLDEEQMPAGEHPLADGSILVIDESGNFVETKEASPTNTEPDEARAKETLKRKQNLAKIKAKQKQKLEEESDPESKEALKARIKELEDLLADLTSKAEEAVEKAEEAKTEIEELKKKFPTAKPAVQKEKEKDSVNLSATDRMAVAIKTNLKQRKK